MPGTDQRSSLFSSNIKYFLYCLILAFLFGACNKQPEKAGIGKEVEWSKLSGWVNDQQSKAWPALLQSCKALSHKKTDWKFLCSAAEQSKSPNDAQARSFFEQYFVPHQVINDNGTQTGVITGYFVSALKGSSIRDDVYKYAIYRRPDNMLTVNLKSLYSKLSGMRLRGRVKGSKLIPYFDRAQIDTNPSPLKGNEIIWVKDPIALFFMHIQGSGNIELPDGKIITVGYADQNGHPYVPVGRFLIKYGGVLAKDMSLQTIRKWMLTYPEVQQELMNLNPSYIFFRILPEPIGALNVPLIAGRSIAVDRRKIPLGLPVWIETSYPDIKKPGKSLQKIMAQSKHKLHRLFMAQDVGGAIKGTIRADIFWGQGVNAKVLAGHMNQKGKMYVLVPKMAASK